MSLDITKLSHTTVSYLVASGWYPERSISAERFVLERERSNIPVFPAAIEFYNSFGDMYIQYPAWRHKQSLYTCRIYEHIFHSPWLCDLCVGYGKALERMVTWLGDDKHLGNVLMDFQGAIYITDLPWMELDDWNLLRCGTNAVEALNCLCDKADPVLISVTDESRDRINEQMTRLKEERQQDKFAADAWWNAANSFENPESESSN